jgi:hypothetical protein
LAAEARNRSAAQTRASGAGAGAGATRDVPAPAQGRVDDKALQEHLWDVWALVRSPRVAKVLLFLAAVTLPPDSGTAMFYFLTGSLGFGRSFISLVSIVSALCAIFGSFLYFARLQSMPFRTLFVAVFLVCTPLGYLQILLVTRTNVAIGIPDRVFLLGDDALQAITVSIIQTPILVIIAGVCPDNLKGTAYELVNSVANICAITSSFLSAGLMGALGISRFDFHNLVLLLLITNTLNLLPLALTWCLPGRERGRTVSAPGTRTPGSGVVPAHSSGAGRVWAGIIISSALAQPRNLLTAVTEQNRFLARRSVTAQHFVAVQAHIRPPSTTDWGLRLGLGLGLGLGPEQASTAPPRPAPYVRVQPVRPGDVIVKGAKQSNFHFVTVSAVNANDINALRSTYARDAFREGTLALPRG